MSILFQKGLTISPEGHPLKPSNFNLYPSSKRLGLSCCSSNKSSKLRSSDDHLKFASTTETESSSLLTPSSDVTELRVGGRSDGIGIVKFLQGKTFFVTGATGFLAKEFHGKSYESFMYNKLVAVPGNIREPNLGLDKHFEFLMAKEVDIIVNSAATTNLHERYNVAIETNTKGPSQVMAFAKNCKKLKLFLQISTAYVNGNREGTIMEKPLRVGESSTPTNSLPTFDIEDEIHLALSSAEAYGDKEMIQLGLQRARKHGWKDSYTFTKAMGETLLGRMRGDVPVVILRPSIIESTYNDPFPGWIEGLRMLDPLVAYYAKGNLSGFVGDPNMVIDVVPVDMVVNAALAAIAKHGGSGKPEMNVYHVTSSVVNPLVFKNMGNFLYQHFSKQPWLGSKGNTMQVKPYKLYTSMDEFLSQVQIDMMIKFGSSSNVSNKKEKKICRMFMEQAKYLVGLSQPYYFYRGRFDNTSTQLLTESLSEEERRGFHFDVTSIDWEDYFLNIHIPGVRKHVMKETGV